VVWRRDEADGEWRSLDLGQGGSHPRAARFRAAGEEAMPSTDAIRRILDGISDWVAARRRLAGFTCGDCYRVSRCNLSPADNCIVRQEQIERGDWEARRKARSFLPESF
jgi:hypothetical protein